MLLDAIPQYFDAPWAAGQLTYKASAGSHKAAEGLQSLLQFTAVAALGGDPWQDLSTSELEAQLAAVLQDHCVSLTAAHTDPIALAFRWAWPPLVGGWMSYDSDELLAAVAGLCQLLCALDGAVMVRHLVQHYTNEQATAADLKALGECFSVIGVPRAVIDVAAPAHRAILSGCDG